jgi:hypothetical protein
LAGLSLPINRPRLLYRPFSQDLVVRLDRRLALRYGIQVCLDGLRRADFSRGNGVAKLQRREVYEVPH